MLTRKQVEKAELRLMTAICSGEVFEGRTVRQERPTCCGNIVDLFASDVSFRELIVGSRVFHLIEPRCPICGVHVRALYTILN